MRQRRSVWRNLETGLRLLGNRASIIVYLLISVVGMVAKSWWVSVGNQATLDTEHV